MSRQEKAAAKRARKALKPGASAYSLRNVTERDRWRRQGSTSTGTRVRAIRKLMAAFRAAGATVRTKGEAS